MKTAKKKVTASKDKSKATNKPASKKSSSKQTIRSVANDAILAGKPVEGVIAAVKKAFPDSKISASAVGWYRGKLKEAGHKLKEQTRGPKPAASVKKKTKASKPVKSEEGEGGF